MNRRMNLELVWFAGPMELDRSLKNRMAGDALNAANIFKTPLENHLHRHARNQDIVIFSEASVFAI